jgi:hypothetical protein
MVRVVEYFGGYEGVRGRMGGLPGWARALVFLAALPGMVLAALSILALGVSILALLVLAVPTYRLVSWAAGMGRREPPPPGPMDGGPVEVKRVDAKILE